MHQTPPAIQVRWMNMFINIQVSERHKQKKANLHIYTITHNLRYKLANDKREVKKESENLS